MQFKGIKQLLKFIKSAVSKYSGPAFNRSCRFLYIVGIQSTRILKRLGRKSLRFFRPLLTLFRNLYRASVGKQLVKIRGELRSIRSGISAAEGRIAAARKRGFFSVLRECALLAGKSFRVHKRVVAAILNFAVPAVAVLALCMTVRYWSTLNFGLVLENNGREIASVADESVYSKATEMVSQRMVHDQADEVASLKFAPNFRLAVNPVNLSSASYVCDKLIEQSNGIIEEASGLYVDGGLWGVVKSGADLRYMLQNLLDSARKGDSSVSAKFSQNVEIVNGLFPTTSIIGTDAMGRMVNGTLKSGVTYMVKPGDTVTSIAKANHMTIEELNKMNGNKLGDSIHPGDLVSLEKAVPKLSVELTKTETYRVAVPYKTITQNDDSQYTDYSKVLKDGSNGLQERTDQVTIVNGSETGRENMSTRTLVNPVDKIVITGTKKRPQNQAGVSSGSFMWPVPSLHTITTYFTWRWGQFHYGLDISGSCAYGQTIVAADGGVVAEAGWESGYGNYVVINHGNGFSTLYGHASTLLVSAGQAVSKGQAIAKVGATGNATGPHCHFEVIKNGTKVDPLSYLP